MRASLCILAPLPCPERQPNANFILLKVFWICDSKTSLIEPLIDLLAHRKTKLWLKNPVFGKNLKFSKKVTLAISVQHWPLVVGSQIELESYSNPLKTREVFHIGLKKTFRIFLGLFGPWPHDWRMFCEYSYDVIRGSNARIL